MCEMEDRIRRSLTGAAVAVVLLTVAACGSSNGPGGGIASCFTPAGTGTCINPSTIRVQNNLLGPILFFKVRVCGTTDFSADLLSNDPVEGKIQPGAQKDFMVEQGCYDLRAEHLMTTDPGPLVIEEMPDVSISPVSIFTWTLSETPGGPS